MKSPRFIHLLANISKLRAWRELVDINMQAYLFAVLYAVTATRSFSYGKVLDALSLVSSLAAYLCYGFLLNDYCDMPTDIKAGKRAEMQYIPASIAVFLIAIFFVAGVLLACLRFGDPYFLALLAVTYFLGTFYSAPPIRFKDRGYLGVFVDMLVEKTLPIVLVFTFFRYASLDALLLVLFFSLMQMKVIFDHQVFDYIADLNSGVDTLAVKLGLETATGMVDLILRPSFVVVFVLLCVAIYFYVPYSFAILFPLLIGYIALRVMIAKNIITRVNVRSDIGDWISRIPFYDGYITASLGVLLLFIAFFATLTYYPCVYMLVLALASQMYIIKGHYLRIFNNLFKLALQKIRRLE